MNQFILRLSLGALLITSIGSIKSQIVIGGIRESGISLRGPAWRQTFIGRLINPQKYALGVFALQENRLTLQNNLFTFPRFKDFWGNSTFDLITIEDVHYIVLAHGKYLYLLKVKNNRIRELNRYLLSKTDQSYSAIQVINRLHESYVFVLNATSLQLHVYSFEGEALKKEALSPYDLHELGIKGLQTVTDGNAIYILITNYLRNTMRIYTFKNGRLLEQRGSPIAINGNSPDAVLTIRQKNITYICIANKLSDNVSLYSLDQGRITEKTALSLLPGAGPTSLSTITTNDRIYLFICNSGTKRISVFMFDNGTFTPVSTVPVQFRLRPLYLRANIIKHKKSTYIAVYNAKWSSAVYNERWSSNIELFKFQYGILTPVTKIDNVPMKVTSMKTIQSPDQFTVEQVLQEKLSRLPGDIVRLIAQYTTLKKGNFPLQKQHLINTFVREQSFNTGRALEFITSMNLVTPTSNKFKILFSDFILPYYRQYYDMVPVEKWLNLIQTTSTEPQTRLLDAVVAVNKQIQKESLLFSPWVGFKLYWLRTKLKRALSSYPSL